MRYWTEIWGNRTGRGVGDGASTIRRDCSDRGDSGSLRGNGVFEGGEMRNLEGNRVLFKGRHIAGSTATGMRRDSNRRLSYRILCTLLQ